MEQRSLRLGDLVDDYCPRERRVTDHVIVALVGDSIRQTRCGTCNAEHEYKEARVPRKKVKDGDPSDLAGGVLVVPRPATSNGQATELPPAAPIAATADAVPASRTDAPSAAGEGANDDETMPDGWLAHRPLIRASLPRTENDVPPPRPIPEFTMHQRQGRGFGGRGFHRGFSAHGGGGGRMPPGRDGHEPDGNRAPGGRGPGGPGGPGGGGPAGPGGPGGKPRHRRRHRRPR
jgi:hypothetical protein